MRAIQVLRRFLVPSFVVTIVYAIKYGCFVSPRAEVELSPLISVGKKAHINSFTKIKANRGPLVIGENALIGTHCFISSDDAGVRIGDYAMISSHVSIIGNKYRYDDLETPICLQEKTSSGIEIGANVWIGAGTVVTDGASIGAGSIIAPNSVVSSKIPPNSVAKGDPATVVFARR